MARGSSLMRCLYHTQWEEYKKNNDEPETRWDPLTFYLFIPEAEMPHFKYVYYVLFST